MTPYEEVAALVVMGFYEDRVPVYSQGLNGNEILSPITAEEANGLVKVIEAKQARIDELMLEYCPDEMTEEQLKIWGESQKPVSAEIENEINNALGLDGLGGSSVRVKSPSTHIREISLTTYGVVLMEHEEAALWLEELRNK